MSDNVLVVQGVRRTFRAENAPARAVRGVDLSLTRGEFVAVLGPPGCGKSRGVNGAAAEA
jgi:putative ABC transport system ATP-binding protein